MYKLIPFLTLFFMSCYTLRSPIGKREMYGNLVTCSRDSSSVMNEAIIIFKYKGHKEVNKDCPNIDLQAYNYLESWPTWIFFDFKERTFFYVTNFRPSKDNSGAYSADDSGGDLKYSRKHGKLILSMPKYNWQKTFLVEFDKRTQLITLKETVNNQKIKGSSKKNDKTLDVLNNKEQQ